MGILEAVKKGFVSANSLIKVIGIFFVFNAIVSLLSVPLTDPARAADPAVVVISIISSIVFFLIFIFLQGGALGAVSDKIKTANIDLGKFVVYGKKFYLRILGLLLLYILIAILVVLLLGLVSAGILLLGDNAITRSIVVLVVTIAALGIITMLIYPIYSIVADDLGPIAAFKKGVLTSLNNFFKTLGLFIVLLLVSVIISFVIGLIIGAITVPLGATISQYVVAIVNALVQSYIPIVMMVSFMGMYLSITSSTQQVQVEPTENQAY